MATATTEMITVYKYKGKGAGADTKTVIPLTTWREFTKKSKDGSRFLDKDAENWRVLKNGDAALIERPMEIVEQLEKQPTAKISVAVDEKKRDEFNAFIVEAEDKIVKEDLVGALESYKKANAVMPDAQYPLKRITELERKLKKNK